MTVTLDTGWSNVDITYSNGDLTAENDINSGNVRPAENKSSGKWYWEVTVGSSSVPTPLVKIGLADISKTNTDAYNPCTTTMCVYNAAAGCGLCFSPDPTLAIGDTIGIAWDVPNRLIWFYKNGVCLNDSGAETGNDGCDLANPTVTFIPVNHLNNNGVNHLEVTWNFGGSTFVGTRPSGFENYDTSTADIGWDKDNTTPGSPTVCTEGAPYVVDFNTTRADYNVCSPPCPPYSQGDQHCGSIYATSNLWPTTGKWYFELDASSTITPEGACHRARGGLLDYQIDFGDDPNSSVIMGVAFDADAKLAWHRFDGDWVNGDPAAGTGGEHISTPCKPYVYFSYWEYWAPCYPIWPVLRICESIGAANRTVIAHWGDTSFTRVAPSGFGALYNNADSGTTQGSITETVGFGDEIVGTGNVPVEINETIAFTDESDAPYPVHINTSESFGIGELIEASLPFDRVITESLSFDDEIKTDPYAVIEEVFGVGEDLRELDGELTDAISFADSISVVTVAVLSCNDISFEVIIPNTELYSTYEVPAFDGIVELPSLEVIGYTGATGEIELPSLSLSAEAAFGVNANANVTLPSLEIAATTGANAAIELPSFEVNATAELGVVAEATIELPSLEILAHSYVNIIANFSDSFPNLRVLAAAGSSIIAEAIITLPSFYLTGISYTGNTLIGDMELPALTMLGSFYLDIDSAGVVTLSVLEVLGSIDNSGQYDSYILEYDRDRSKCV